MDQGKKEVLNLRINEILYYIWDPIGINDWVGPASRDEYDSYVDGLLQMAIEEKSKFEISQHLTSIAVDMMGLEARPESDNKIAELIIDWKQYLEDR